MSMKNNINDSLLPHSSSIDKNDLIFDKKEEIYKAVHKLVDKLTAGLDPEVDEKIRQQLTETFRFWR